FLYFFFSSRRRHTRSKRDWSSDVCSSDLTPFLLEGLDLDLDARRQVKLHQRVDRLRGRLEDVQEPLVGADLELLARLLVDVRREIGRASCRERVEVGGVGGTIDRDEDLEC